MGLGATNELHNLADTATTPKASQAAAYRLQRSRKRFGAHRHDLLVAMRVVNSVEREIVHAEWENWLHDENSKCSHIGSLLRENKTDSILRTASKWPVSQQTDSTRLREIQEWHDDYCASCKEDLQTTSEPGAVR